MVLHIVHDGTKFIAAVIGGHRDKLNQWMVHLSNTLQPKSVHLLLDLFEIFSFEKWTADIRQAYINASGPLEREVFIGIPDPEFYSRPDQ